MVSQLRREQIVRMQHAPRGQCARVRRWRDKKSAPMKGVPYIADDWGGDPVKLIVIFEFRKSIEENIGDAEEEGTTEGSIENVYGRLA
jgi:hypothetical protein